jgi:hypothetical protein
MCHCLLRLWGEGVTANDEYENEFEEDYVRLFAVTSISTFISG